MVILTLTIPSCRSQIPIKSKDDPKNILTHPLQREQIEKIFYANIISARMQDVNFLALLTSLHMSLHFCLVSLSIRQLKSGFGSATTFESLLNMLFETTIPTRIIPYQALLLEQQMLYL
jgi:hypothetical protein